MEVKTIPMLFAHHLQLEMPEERVEDDDKVLTTRYTPLGVVGAICPWYGFNAHAQPRRLQNR